jgi:hypothetical protein
MTVSRHAHHRLLRARFKRAGELLREEVASRCETFMMGGPEADPSRLNTFRANEGQREGSVVAETDLSSA